MKTLIKITSRFSLVFALLILFLKFSGNGYLIKGIWASYLHGKTSASIDDAKFFETNTVKSGHATSTWPLHKNYNQKALSLELTNTLEKTKSVAFLVIQNDSVIQEKYWNGYTDSSLSNSFSMAKSITTLLCQIAIQKGILLGWDQKVIGIFPTLKGVHASELELWHLSTMSSGLDWNEKYTNPFNVTAKAYYGEDVKTLLLSLPVINEPGKTFNYQSGSTQLLGLCLREVTGKSLSSLATEWLWGPLQAEHDALWHIDNEGCELAYCCFNSNARDFARFGKLMLHYGNWNGTQILDSSFVSMATTKKFAPQYGYSFWLDDASGTKVFYQRGILGQYIITIPAYKLVIVRLGQQRLPNAADGHTQDFHMIVEEVLKMVKDVNSSEKKLN